MLCRLALESNLPWLIIEDYNDILTPDEKKRGVPRQNWLYSGFCEAILDCNLANVPLNGHPVTWSHGRGANNRLEERLHRAMGTPAWHSRFHAATLTNLVALISDHSPILLDTSLVVVQHRARSFRFENKWLAELDIGWVIESSWEGFKDFQLLH